MLVVFGLAVLSNSETAVRPIMGWIAVTMTSLDPNEVARTEAIDFAVTGLLGRACSRSL